VFPANNLDKYFNDLEQQNWTLIPIDIQHAQKLLNSAKTKLYSKRSRSAGITGSSEPVSALRNDRIFWLESNSTQNDETETKTLQQLAELTESLRQYFRASLSEVECHYSVYETGHFYQKHRDITAENNRRFFSFVLYLNKDWNKSDAGELVAYQNSSVLFKVSPQLGSMILFRSDLEHEVLPTNRSRYALTGWIRK
jgi:SM-20-related protein